MNISDVDKERLNRSCPMMSSARGVGLGTALQNIEKLASLYDPDRILRVSQLATGNVEDGSSWENAYKTFEAAIDKARFIAGGVDIDYTNTHHIYIFIAPGDYSAEAAQLKFSAQNVHIIGLGNPSPGNGVIINPSTTTFAFGGSGSGVELANLCIRTTQAISALWWDYIDGCWFHDLMIYGDSVNSTYGIWTTGLYHSTIERVRIAGMKTACIHIEGGDNRYLYNSVIRDNMLSAHTTCATAIKVVGGDALVGELLIAHNYIFGDNFTKCIDIDHNAAEVMLAGNYVHSASEGGTARDEHTA